MKLVIPPYRSSATITGTNAGDFSIISPTTVPVTIADGGANVIATLQCQPTAAGTRIAQLQIATNDPAQPLVSYDLECSGTIPLIPGYGSTPVPSSTINFGNTVINTAVTKTLEISETGNTALLLDSITVTGSHASDFSIISPTTVPVTIADGGANVIATLQCQPTAAGTSTAQLQIATNDPAQPLVSYDLECAGTIPLIPGYASTPVPSSTINFGNTVINTAVTKTIEISETGNTTLQLLSATITGTNASDFSIISPTTVPVTIADGGANVIATLQCQPTSAGTSTAQLQITTNDPAQPSVSYDLECAGTIPLIPGYASTPAPNGTINFGNTVINTAVTKTIEISETGNTTLELSSATITGSNAGDFSIISPTTVPVTIADGGANVIATLQCQPTAAGTRTAQLQIATNDPTQSLVSYDLECSGTIPLIPGYGSTPAPNGTINFGNTVINTAVTKTIEISETGNTTLELSSATITGSNASDFSIISPTTVPVTIADGGANVIATLQCQPTAAGTSTAQLQIATNDPAQSLVSYDLECAGTVPLIPGYGSTPAPNGTINFGNTVINTAVTKTIEISETGNTTLQLLSATITGTNASDFSIISPTTVPVTIADGGANVIATLQCQPTSAGTSTAQLQITTNDPTQSLVSYDLECSGTVPLIPGYASTPVPSSTINFGNTVINTAVTKTIEISETGNTTLQLLSATITGTNASDFSIISPTTVPVTIADGGANVIATLQCQPTAAGTRTAQLQITTNDPAQPSVSYDLECAGTIPLIPGYASTPAPNGTINFGNTVINTAVTKTIEISETGNTTLQLLSATITGTNASDFSIISPTTVPVTIADGGANVIATLQCQPTAAGTRIAQLQITTNDPAQPSVSYDLECAGTIPLIPGYASTPAPNGTINFGNTVINTAVTKTIEISETGNTTLELSSATITGSNASDFSIISPTTVPVTIADGGANVIATLQCQPTAAGTRTAKLQIATNDPTQSLVSYDLECSGTIPLIPGYGSTPAPNGTINFGNTVINTAITQTIEISETGNTTLELSSATITGTNAGDFSIISPTTFPVTIADGGTNVIATMQCQPTAAGTRTAQLQIATNDPAQPLVSYDLECSGTIPLIPGYASTPVPSSTVNFGNTVINTAVTKTLEISETGNTTLQIASATIIGANASDFSIISPTAVPVTIADSGANVIATLQCQPTADGTRTAQLQIATNDPTQSLVSYDLECAGTVPLIPGYGSTPLPGSTVNFGSTIINTAVTKTLEISETGNTALLLDSMTVTGSHASDFSIISPTTVPVTIADGGANVIATLQCQPTAAGTSTAQLQIATNDPAQSLVSYDLECAGTIPLIPGYGSTPAPNGTINFGNTVINTAVTKTLEISETGNTTLQIASATITGTNAGDFSIISPTAVPVTIADGGANVMATLQCQPTAAGTSTAQLQIATNDPAQPLVSYDLECSGTIPLIPGYGSTPVPSSTINFGSTVINTAVTKTIDISETGNTTIRIGISNDYRYQCR